MQVFLPEPSFYASAQTLDRKRLVKQLLEGRQIMTILVGENKTRAWTRHPAVLMFNGHHGALYDYLYEIMQEMDRRGYSYEKNWSEIDRMMLENPQTKTYPHWMLDDEAMSRVIITHRGNLFKKDPDYYAQYANEGAIYKQFVCCDRCNYQWPVKTHGYVPVLR